MFDTGYLYLRAPAITQHVHLIVPAKHSMHFDVPQILSIVSFISIQDHNNRQLIFYIT